ncbi:iron complex transport system ATP-binding protein [Amphritea atlantica]|uniref:Iron complex transport system ATP-binding protein n=1 Tax=Amphritea atlantica TaxID=355243 RepID=A0A1H9LH95_9GAMM|nr:heme ABC transporter ATP-binding protein [Amphritea atlantica]SER10293.1 iron complex transport system ATP-binding protein [Amphritea atlantica]
MLTATGLCLKRNGQTLLDDISVELPPGEITVLLGPNGAGKSTLLGMLCGLNRADSGRVCLAGVELSGMEPQLRARYLAMYTQQQPLNFPFRVAEVVALGCYPLLLDRSATAARVAACLQQFQLESLAQRDYTSLSGGEQQRVQVARVLAQAGPDCQVLLLDEPVSEMDLRYQQLLLQQIRMVAAAGVSVCCVLHDLNLAAQLADRVVLLQQGRMAAVGPVDSVMTERQLSDLYQVTVRKTDTLSGPVFISQSGP